MPDFFAKNNKNRVEIVCHFVNKHVSPDELLAFVTVAGASYFDNKRPISLHACLYLIHSGTKTMVY